MWAFRCTVASPTKRLKRFESKLKEAWRVRSESADKSGSPASVDAFDWCKAICCYENLIENLLKRDAASLRDVNALGRGSGLLILDYHWQRFSSGSLEFVQKLNGLLNWAIDWNSTERGAYEQGLS